MIATQAVAAKTLVWCEGMVGWQKAEEIPGLFSGASGPPALSQSGGSLLFDAGMWELLGRSLLFAIGLLLVIPAPWAATGLYRWIVSRLRVPNRRTLLSPGRPATSGWFSSRSG